MRFGAFLVYFAEQEHWSLIVDLTELVSPMNPHCFRKEMDNISIFIL